MTAPVRLRLSRRAGFDLQALSLATNGLPAVKVDRSTMFGNPFVVSHDKISGRQAVAQYRALLESASIAQTTSHPQDVRHRREYALNNLAALRGKNLACWCDGPWCHADVLLDISNRPICEAV
jgi:hypothetical protein